MKTHSGGQNKTIRALFTIISELDLGFWSKSGVLLKSCIDEEQMVRPCWLQKLNIHIKHLFGLVWLRDSTWLRRKSVTNYQDDADAVSWQLTMPSCFCICSQSKRSMTFLTKTNGGCLLREEFAFHVKTTNLATPNKPQLYVPRQSSWLLLSVIKFDFPLHKSTPTSLLLMWKYAGCLEAFYETSSTVNTDLVVTGSHNLNYY